MANRSYLYSLGNRPTSYRDRPETISGLSEWPYDIPFVYRLLMSADPQLCGSLVSDGFDSEQEGRKTRLHAISSAFAPGFERFRRFAEIVKVLAAAAPLGALAPAPPAAGSVSVLGRLKQMFSATPPRVEAPTQAPAAVEQLPGWLDETVAFLAAHRNDFLLLETVELDLMSESDEEGLRHCVEDEIETCRHVGAAFDALPADIHEAATLLRRLAIEEGVSPLEAFYGLRFDDDCDSTRTGATERPLGLAFWSETLYFGLLNRAEFEARSAAD